MPLDERQLKAIQDAVQMIEATEDGCGEVTIVIKNHHPHLIKPSPSLKMPFNGPELGVKIGYTPGREG